MTNAGVTRSLLRSPNHVEATYVHGYTPREAERLVDQANALTHLLHRDTAGLQVIWP